MKILVVQDWLRSGGTERQTVLLSNAFAAAGHEATLLTFRPGGRLAGTIAAGVRRRSLQTLDLRLDWFAPGLVTAARQAAPDVILCMGRMANCYAGSLQDALAPVPVVATMRTGKRLPWLFRRSLQKVTHVVANSADARDLLARGYGVAPAKVSVIYNSLVFPSTTAATPEGRRELRTRQGATDTATILLSVAMFRPEKNQRELVEIAAALDNSAASDWQLWLAGDGPARAACEQLVAARGLGGRVKFVGFHRDPTPLYSAADVAVHASWSESLSNFLIEAQAHGLPAVAYAAQGISECFVPERTGWAIPRADRAAFQARLSALMADPADVRATRAAEARTFARTTFDPARQVQAYLATFEGLRQSR